MAAACDGQSGDRRRRGGPSLGRHTTNIITINIGILKIMKNYYCQCISSYTKTYPTLVVEAPKSDYCRGVLLVRTILLLEVDVLKALLVDSKNHRVEGLGV